MPTYVLDCPSHGRRETVARMADAKEKMPCPECGVEAQQIFTPPMFSEDRLRFWKGPMGDGYSHALGAPMPASREDRDRLARAKGVEFCTVDELRADSKEAADALDYTAHVQAGGARDDATPNPHSEIWKEPPTS